MPQPHDMVDRLRMLFKQVGHYRRFRDWSRTRLRWRFWRKAARTGLTQAMARAWGGGYVRIFGDCHVYVPSPPDVQGLRLLTEPFVPDPMIAAQVRPGDTVIDVGANLGGWAVPLALRVGPAGRVIAFEPTPRLADAVAKTARINRFDWVTVEAAALGDRVGEAVFAIEDKAGGDSALSSLKTDGEGVTVPLTTLDDYLERHPLDRLDLLKIDVEGWERAVIEGARRTLAGLRPRLVFETGHEPDGSTRAAIAEMLDGLGYDLIGAGLDDGLIELGWSDYTGGRTLGAGAVYNLLALPRAERAENRR